MTLIQKGIVIVHARKDWNLFILNFAAPNKVMQALSTNINAKVIAIYGQG